MMINKSFKFIVGMTILFIGSVVDLVSLGLMATIAFGPQSLSFGIKPVIIITITGTIMQLFGYYLLRKNY